jgi:2-oxoisovalerate dehydrogenase E1 component beta subunit
MAATTLAEAVRDTLAQEMRRDDGVVVVGHAVGKMGGVFHATEGLLEEFGEERVVDMPLDEGGLVGAAVGMALYGLRPVAEIQFADFVYPGLDQIISEAAKLRYRSGGQYSCPLVVRVPYGGGVGGGPYQSQSPETFFTHTAGLVVAAPSTPADAAGLLRSALCGDDPVVLMEPKALYGVAADAAVDDDVAVPFGVAERLREGGDVTVVAYGAMVRPAQQAAEQAAEHGIDIDLLDLRTLMPFDIGTVLESVAKTGRAVLVQEAPRSCGYAAELAAVLAEKAVFHLQAPVLRVTGLDTPFSHAAEHTYVPDNDRVLGAIRAVAEF